MAGARARASSGSTRTCGRERHERLGVRGFSVASGGISGVDGDLARGDVEAGDGAAEELERGNGLVVGDFVAGFVDAREREVAVLARLAVLDAVDRKRRVACLVELVCVRPLRAQRHRLASEPVADVVGVAVHERDAHGRRVEELLQVFDEVEVDEVAGLLECVVDVVVGEGVVCVHTESLACRVQVEVVHKI